MTPDPAVSASPSVIEVMSAGAVPQLVSRPDSVKFHEIEDQELERIMRIERPIALAIASGTLGAAVGLLPALCDAVGYLLAGTPLPVREAVLTCAFMLCVGVGLVNAKEAYKGKLAADAFLADIRKRPMAARH